jgi:hypothetical protein
MCFSSWLAENGRKGRKRRERRADCDMDGTVLTCLHQFRPALHPVAEKCVRVGTSCKGGLERDKVETVGSLVLSI